MNENAWLIYNGIEDCIPYPDMTFICLDQIDALESYMALVEEEMYETFYAMCQDRFEDVDQDWEERAQWMRLWDTLWEVMEVPIIYGNTCC